MIRQHKKPTAKQLRAIDNITKGWKITKPELVRKPNTVIQAAQLIKELVAEVDRMKVNNSGFDDTNEELEDCMSEAGFFH